MPKILILFAHPVLEKSRVHSRLVKQVQHLEGITFHDLYELYPDFDIDIRKEQELLLQHDIIVWQHPFYWYSCPAIIKQWMDLVLEHGWAYGSEGKQLTGKKIFNAISGGGSQEAYAKGGRNNYTIADFMAPFRQTAQLCNMIYMPPYAILGTHKLNRSHIEQYALQYQQLLVALRDGHISEAAWQQVEFMNELIPVSQAQPASHQPAR